MHVSVCDPPHQPFRSVGRGAALNPAVSVWHAAGTPRKIHDDFPGLICGEERLHASRGGSALVCRALKVKWIRGRCCEKIVIKTWKKKSQKSPTYAALLKRRRSKRKKKSLEEISFMHFIAASCWAALESLIMSLVYTLFNLCSCLFEHFFFLPNQSPQDLTWPDFVTLILKTDGSSRCKMGFFYCFF